jgi:D-alanyl-D-alanine carboxypeptidase (penicillin-binding protein 5/6)
MLRIFFFLFVFSFVSLSYGAASPVPKAPALAARSYLLADFHSGRVLVEKDIDVRIEPASITKIMTAYVVYQSIQRGLITRKDLVVVSEKAWQMEGSRMFIEAGDQVVVDDLLKGLIIQSGNDASVALAEHIAGSEEGFASMMNTEAGNLGMTGTHYVNVTGMPTPQHYTTARDILLLTAALIHDFPEEYKLYAERSFVYNEITQSNRNRLLWMDKSVDGVKTGHTKSAGYCLVASAERNNMRLISVVLGTDSDKKRTGQSRSLLNFGFRFYDTQLLYSKAQKLADARVWQGAEQSIELGVNRDLYVTFPRGQYDLLDAQLDRPKTLQAPVIAGQTVGSIKVAFNNDELYEVPLVALHPVAKGGFFRRMVDKVLLMLE